MPREAPRGRLWSQNRTSPRRSAQRTQSSSGRTCGSRSEDAAGDGPPAVEGKWERGGSTHGKAAGGRAVSQSDVPGGNTSSLRGHGGDSGCTAWRARASGEQHSHHRRRPKGQGAQLLDRGLGTAVHILETSAAWGPPAQPGAQAETTCRKPLEAVLCRTRTRARSRARVREVNGTQGTAENRAGAEGSGPGEGRESLTRSPRGAHGTACQVCARGPAAQPQRWIRPPSSPRRAGGRWGPGGQQDSGQSQAECSCPPQWPRGPGVRLPRPSQ